MADNIPTFPFVTEEDWYGEITILSAEDGTQVPLTGRGFVMLITPAGMSNEIVGPSIFLSSDPGGGLEFKVGEPGTLIFRVDRTLTQNLERREYTANIYEIVGGKQYLFLPMRIQYSVPSDLRSFLSRFLGVKVSFSKRLQPIITPIAIAGRQGAAGATIVNGTVPPVGANGKDGDYYIEDRTASGQGRRMWGPKQGGAWPGTPWSIQVAGISDVPGLNSALSARLLASNNLSDLTSTTAAKAILLLDKVDNTADAEKPVSVAQGMAIAARLAATANLSDVTDKDAGRRALKAVAISSVEVNIEDFIPLTDNHTSALRAAYNALVMRGGGKLKIPRTYVVKGFPGETEIFKFTVPIVLSGENPLQSQILCTGDTPASCDIIRWEPSAIGFYFGIENLFIGPVNPDAPSGNHALRIRTTALAYIENAFIKNSWLWGGNGYGVYQETTAALGTGAGTVHQMLWDLSKFTGLLGGGMLTACGDNFTMRDCGVSGKGRGITVIAMSGTARVKIESLNSRAMTGGAVKLVGTDQAQLIDCQLEQFTPFDGPADERGLIVLDNAINTKIDSSVNGFGNIENCLLLKNSARGTRVGKSTFANATSQTAGDTWHITLASGAGPDNIFDNIDYLYNNIPDVVRFRNQSTAVATHLHTKNASGRVTQSFGATRTSATVFDGAASAFSWVIASAEKIVMNATALYPSVANSMALGGPVNPWTQVYAQTTTISTSDERLKTEVACLTEAETAAARDLAREIGGFRFLASVAEKGDAARIHIGMTVQRAIEIMESHGLDPLAYAFICHDSWDAQEALYDRVLDANGEPVYETVLVSNAVHEQVFDEEGRPTGTTRVVKEDVYETKLDEAGQPIPMQTLIRPAVEAGDRYGFRTDQLLMFMAAGFEARLSALEDA